MAQLNSEVKALFVNGVPVPIKDQTFNANMGGFTRTPVMGGGGRKLGATRQGVAGECSFTLAYQKGFDIRATLDVEEAQIRVVFDRGDEWLMTNADLQDPAALSAGEGDIEVTFNGDPWKQVKFAA